MSYYTARVRVAPTALAANRSITTEAFRTFEQQARPHIEAAAERFIQVGNENEYVSLELAPEGIMVSAAFAADNGAVADEAWVAFMDDLRRGLQPMLRALGEQDWTGAIVDEGLDV